MWALLRGLVLMTCMIARVAMAQTDGLFDASFAGTGYFAFPGDNKNANAQTQARKLFVATNGDLIAAGQANNSTGSGESYWWLGALTSAGQLDPAFGASDASGRTTECQLGFVCFTTQDVYVDSLLQPDGKMLMLSELALSRLNSTASALDTAGVAGGTGQVSNQYIINNVGGQVAVDGTLAGAVTMLPSGKVLYAGTGKYNTTGVTGFGVVRLNSDLSLDTTFNAGIDGNGVTFAGGQYVGVANIPGSQAIGLQSDGSIILAGVVSKVLFVDPAEFAYGAMAIARLTPQGALDTSFGSQGVVALDLSGVPYNLLPATTFVPTQMAIDRADRIYITTLTVVLIDGHPSAQDMLVIRFNPDGSLDQGFGTSGVVVTSFPTCNFGTRPTSLAFDSAGRILVSVDCQGTFEEFGIARLRGDTGSVDTSFGFNGFSHGDFSATSTADYAQGILIDRSGHPVLWGSSLTATSVLAGVARITYDLIYTANFETTPRGCSPPDCD